jgi:hypothetical protein
VIGSMVLQGREPLGNVSIDGVEAHDDNRMQDHRGQGKHIRVGPATSRIEIHSWGSVLGDCGEVKILRTDGIVFDVSLDGPLQEWEGNLNDLQIQRNHHDREGNAKHDASDQEREEIVRNALVPSILLLH